MIDPYVRLSVGEQVQHQWVYDSSADTYTRAISTNDACELFVRLLITTGAEPRFVYGSCKRTFQEWLNRQPNKAELAELINLQEMVW